MFIIAFIATNESMYNEFLTSLNRVISLFAKTGTYQQLNTASSILLYNSSDLKQLFKRLFRSTIFNLSSFALEKPSLLSLPCIFLALISALFCRPISLIRSTSNRLLKKNLERILTFYYAIQKRVIA